MSLVRSWLTWARRIASSATAPTITDSLAPLLNAAGWARVTTTVTFTCADPALADGSPSSGLATCTPPPTVGTSVANQRVTGTAEDRAGNAASDTALVSVDTVPPTIAAAPDRAPNASGWYRADVTIGFTCSDTPSGIAAGGCPAPIVLREGANQGAAGTATDAAGNTASTSLAGVNVDETKPVVTYGGNAGSYTVDQQVNITCAAADALSGLQSTTCQSAVGPAHAFAVGNNTLSATATDKAGNVGAATTSFTVTVSVQSLATLTTHLVQGSARYQALSAPQKAAADRLTEAATQYLSSAWSRLTPAPSRRWCRWAG